MTVTVRIDRLVLEGLPVERQQGEAVLRAVREELTRLLRANGLGLSSGFAVPQMRVDSMEIERQQPSAVMTGRQIARALYTCVAPARDVRTGRR